MDPSMWPGIFVLLFVGIILALVIKFSGSKEKKLSKKLMKAAAETKIEIVNHETWSNGVVGIDKTGQNLIFISTYENKEELNGIHLQEVKECILFKDEDKEGVERLSLKVIFIKPDKSPIFLCFYNSGSDGDYGRAEFQIRLEKWKKVINKK